MSISIFIFVQLFPDALDLFPYLFNNRCHSFLLEYMKHIFTHDEDDGGDGGDGGYDDNDDDQRDDDH